MNSPLCILELQEQLRPRALIVTTVRRIRVDEDFSVDILLFREFHGDDVSRRWEMFAKLFRMGFR